MLYFPADPGVADQQRARGAMHLRYEDVCQDGRLTLYGLPSALGQVVWRRLMADHAVTRLGRSDGVIPILTRLVLRGDEETVSIARPLDATGCFQLAHTVDAAGEVDRILMNLWVDLHGVAGRTYAPPPPDHGATVQVGAVFAEHVFTRLFAPAGQRKVLSLADPDLPAVPPQRWSWRPPEVTVELPDGAEPIDAEPTAAADLAFGLCDTDSNQHVNSLVYPRLFEHAALQRFAGHGLSTEVLARYAEIAYRKPCFAGQRVRILLRTYRHGDRLGAAGSFVPADDSSGRPYCWLHMQFR